MASYRIVFSLLSLSNIFFCRLSASAFLATTISSSNTKSQCQSWISPQCPNTSSHVLHAGFEQLPGESTTDFIKRITNESKEMLNQEKKVSTRKQDKNDKSDSKPVGKYQRIEDWDAERNAKGELSWEEKVQFDGQRFGNQLKQDSILRRHLGTF